MDPNNLIKDETAKLGNLKSVMQTILTQYNEAITTRNILEHTWARDQKIVKGIPIYAEKQNSSVRKRPKIRFRKVWSAVIRVLAALYQSFLSDKNKFTIKGFDNETDFVAAKVLETMTRYRLNWLFRRRDGFTKLLWALYECITPGLAVIKVHWKYDEEAEIDEPALTNYPLEQVGLDWQASTLQESRYVYLENYLTKDEMEELGYENIDKAAAVKLPNTPLRSTRYYETADPTNTSGGEGSDYNSGSVGSAYPEPGSNNSNSLAESIQDRYKVVECFYKKNGKIYLAVVDVTNKIWLKKPQLSPYGTIYPIAVGSALLEPHKLVPESLIAPLAGPQEDLNMTLNLRKDNQLLAMMGGWSIDKFGGVDTQSLSNLRPGFIVRRNPGQGLIEPIKLPDVTQTSHIEAGSDISMIDDMIGVPPIKQGLDNSSKTGVTQLNLQEANAKENLFIATVSETLFRQIIYLLAYEIQLFETDEKIFRVANSTARKDLNIQPEQHDNVFDVSFDMDVEVDVGINETSRAIELQRLFMFMDKAIQSNQQLALFLQAGIKVPNPQMIDVSQGLKDLAKKLGIDDYKNYLIPVEPPAQPEEGGGAAKQAAAGATAPQPNAQSGGEEEFQSFLRQALQR